MIAAAITIRFDVDPIRPAHADFPSMPVYEAVMSQQVAQCILDAANSGVGLGAGADLLLNACESVGSIPWIYSNPY